MVDSTLRLPGLSPVAGKDVIARFDGGSLSSDAGVLVLREIEWRLGVAELLAACIADPRDPDRTAHRLAEIIRFRLLAIAAGYADGDATSLRLVPAGASAHRARHRRHFDTAHGAQQLSLFNAHYDEYGFQPMVVFDGEGRFIAALLRPAKRPSGVEIRAVLRPLVRAIRAHWPRIEILVRADGHYACPEVLDWCEAGHVDYVLGLPSTSTLRRHITSLEARTSARFTAAPSGEKVRRFKEFYDCASTWRRVHRIIARIEAGPQTQGPAVRRLHWALFRPAALRLGWAGSGPAAVERAIEITSRPDKVSR